MTTSPDARQTRPIASAGVCGLSPSRFTKTKPCQSSTRNSRRPHSARWKPLASCISGHAFRRPSSSKVHEWYGQRKSRVWPEPGGPSRGSAGAVAEARRHDVHAAMRAGARERAHAAVFVAHDHQRLAEQIESDEIAGLGELREVRHALPLRAEHVLLLPAVVRLAGVNGRRGAWWPRSSGRSAAAWSSASRCGSAAASAAGSRGSVCGRFSP